MYLEQKELFRREPQVRRTLRHLVHNIVWNRVLNSQYPKCLGCGMELTKKQLGDIDRHYYTSDCDWCEERKDQDRKANNRKANGQQYDRRKRINGS